MKNKKIVSWVLFISFFSCLVLPMRAQSIRLWLAGSHSDKKLSISKPSMMPGLSQDIDSTTPSAIWGGYFLSRDISGTNYSIYLWVLSTSGTTTFKAEIMINNSVVATKLFSSSSSYITSGKLYNFAGIDPFTKSGDEVKLKISYISGYGGAVAWRWGDPSSYIKIPSYGPTEITENEDSIKPDRFVLMQNYPNPFNSETTIRYQLPKISDVNIIIYKITGQYVKTLVDQTQPAGYYSISWNGKNDEGQGIASGVYLYTLRANDIIQTRKMILVR